MKKILSILLLSMLLSMTSFAQYVDGGTDGNITWEVAGPTGNYTLTISGNGQMPNYGYPDVDGTPFAPWFQYNESITTAEIKNGVTTIGDGAFYNCIALTSIIIPNSVTAIRSGAFYRCLALPAIIIPNGVTAIRSSAFAGCAALHSITIPNSVTSIWDWVFVGCTALTSITVENENPNYSSSGGVLFNKEKTVLICCPGGKEGSYIIPNSVTKIGMSAFSGCIALTSIAIPSGVTTLEFEAFSFCSALTSVTNLNSIPVKISLDVFKGVDISACTLKVPISAVSAYQEAPVWKNFNIEGIEVGIEQLIMNNEQLIIYPNPTTGQLTINNEQLTINNVAVFDIYGRILSTFNFQLSTNKIDISHLSSGIYFVRIETEAGAVMKKVVKQ